MPKTFYIHKHYIIMDNLKKKGPKDDSRININEPYEVTYWTAKFGVTEAKLKEAVRAVGVMVKDVRKYLGK